MGKNRGPVQTILTSELVQTRWEITVKTHLVSANQCSLKNV